MAAKKTKHTRTPEQQEQDRLKQLERARRRAGGVSATDATNAQTEQQQQQEQQSSRDYLDGFEQSIGLFGDASVANGEAGQIFEYNNGELQLHLADVNGGAVKFMSHFVWNAALVMAEYIEAANVIDVRGQRGLFSVKRGAAFTTLTDYPDPAIVQNIERNWYENLVETRADKQSRLDLGTESILTDTYKDLMGSNQDTKTDSIINPKRRECEQRVRCAVRGHAWGESVEDLIDCLPPSSASSHAGYDWILMADTLWVSEGHASLLTSCQRVLAPGGKILVCCGLHTGYNTVQRFMALARSDAFGFHVRLVEIRRVPLWGDTRTEEELRQESAQLREENMEQFTVEERNRTVLVYEMFKA
ncbi:hypothetical protein BGZ94_008151 [Podila epigama]|nr:hypothetical protein BGZ94_008151 [Podila epigama]